MNLITWHLPGAAAMFGRFPRRAFTFTHPFQAGNHAIAPGRSARSTACASCVLVAFLAVSATARAEIDGIPEANVIGFGCVDMEGDYVPRVLTCENGAASYEALKAQAVAARTYAYYQLMLRGEIADGQIDQVYSCSYQPEEIHYLAAAETECEILTYSVPPTEASGVISSFYVAGAYADYIGTPPYLHLLADPTNTERYVTYNLGLSGGDIVQTPLGRTTPDPLDFTDNRGCMSQNGSDALSDAGWDYHDILRFYYGEDIEFTIIADCTNGPPLDSCLPPDCNSNGIDDADDIASGESVDCNATGVPDECELEGDDCNSNGVPDECDFPRVVVYEEDFDSHAGWTIRSAGGDFTAEDAFDYSVHGIPAAPNGDSNPTRGLKFTVNSNDDTAAADAVSAFPPDLSLSGNYRVAFDMWINYNGGPSGSGSTGSTEFATFGVNHLNTETIWTDTANSNGLWFAVTGEGGASQDYRAYREGTLLSATEGGFEAGSLNASAVYYQHLFPGSEFETPGSPGKQWVRVEIDLTDGVISWYIDGTLIATRLDKSATSGTIMLGCMDIFSSISGPEADNFVIYDNLQVTVLDDCNGNGVVDGCDIVAKVAIDCNRNGVPDDCEVANGDTRDCNTNGVPDICDIVGGTSKDCNKNNWPDSCDIAAQRSDDCDSNAVPDECQSDCNDNNVADVCDIADGASEDCDDNDVPDECDLAEGGADVDCDANGLLDVCEIAAGTTPDCYVDDADSESPADSDGDGVPDADDECPQTEPGQTVDANGCAVGEIPDDDSASQDVPTDSRADSDGDSVIDALDLCPDTPPGTPAVDANGCPIDSVITDSNGETAGRPVAGETLCGATGCGGVGSVAMSLTLLGLTRLRRRRVAPSRSGRSVRHSRRG